MDGIVNIIRHEIDAIGNIPTSNFIDVVDIIYQHVHVWGGKLVTSGMGKAGQIALNISTTFSSTGTPSIYLHPAEAQHGDLGILQPNDVMLILSNSGETREVIELMHLVDGLYPAIKFIAITSNPKSTLALNSNILLPTGNPVEVCPLKLTPTTSTTVMTVMGDILITLMMKKIKFTPEQYAKRHHGGYLGSVARGERND